MIEELTGKDVRKRYTEETGREWFYIDEEGDKVFTRAYILGIEEELVKAWNTTSKDSK